MARVPRYDGRMNDLNGLGFAFADLGLSTEQCEYLLASLPAAEQRGGIRKLLAHPTLLALIRHKQLGNCLRSFTGRQLVAVAARVENCLTGDSAPQWRQESVVAVRERMDVRGFGPWTTQVGVPHVGAPSSVLKQMLILRVVLDGDADDAPALQVIPGSHRGGKLDDDGVRDVVKTVAATTLRTPTGKLLLLNPLLVHAVAASAEQRRYHVLQIVFAPAEAISPLQWSAAVQLHPAA